MRRTLRCLQTRIFWLGMLLAAGLFDLPVDLKDLFFSKFRIERSDPLFTELHRTLSAIFVIVIIREVVNAVFYTVQDSSVLVPDISVIIIKQYPDLFCFSKAFD